MAVLVALIGGFIWWLHARNFESTDDAYVDGHVVRVAPQIAGQVVQVYVDDNTPVKTGQPLLRIDPSDPRARVDQALAQEAQAKAQIAQAQAQIRVSQAAFDQASAAAAGAAAQATNAAKDLGRYRYLVSAQPNAVAPEQVDQATATAQNTAAQRRAATDQARGAKAQIAAAQTQITAAQAQLKNAAAQAEQAQINLNYTELYAPFAGHVTQKNVAVGGYLQPGQQVMAIVPQTLWITANFKETQLDHMRPGQRVDIRIDAFPSVTFEGHVDSIQRGAGQAFALLPPENATGNFVKVVQRVPVKIVIDRPDPRNYPLGPGMSAEPRVRVR
ncbi:MAG TPA: HlyD family secretion protein [Caulobacteraceae bacterium]|nr:HlyD family secretion protein [Caulobacteraceae bacterium]